MRPTRRAPKGAGANPGMRSPVGQHTRNPGWKAGSWWVVCQVCGFDYRSEHMSKRWDGAIVCKTCWEPRHPQDFVRSRRERIQVPGMTNPDGLLSQTSAEGSTDVPPPSFNLGGITIGTIPDQTYNEGNTISTITGAVFESFVDTFGDTITVASYSYGGSPQGTSINTTTGDITGTLGNESETTGQESTVYALYTNGQTFGSSFTWVISDAGVHPDNITGSCKGGWYDFSEDEGNWADAVDGTLITSGASIGETINKFYPTNRSLDLNSYLTQSTSEPTWTANVRNGLGAASFDDEGAPATEVNTLEGASALVHCPYGPFEAFCVFEVPAVGATTSGIWAATNARGNRMHISTDGGGGQSNLQSVFNDEQWADYNDITPVGAAWNTWSGDWVVVYAKYDSLGNCDFQVNGESFTADEAAEHDANPEAPFAVLTQGLRLGATGNASGSAYLGPTGPLDADMGEFICFGNSTSYNNEGSLSTDEVAGLTAWLMSKWNITDEIAS